MSTEEDSERKRSHIYGLLNKTRFIHEWINNSPVPWEYGGDLYFSSLSLRILLLQKQIVNLKKKGIFLFSPFHNHGGCKLLQSPVYNPIAFNVFHLKCLFFLMYRLAFSWKMKSPLIYKDVEACSTEHIVMITIYIYKIIPIFLKKKRF